MGTFSKHIPLHFSNHPLLALSLPKAISDTILALHTLYSYNSIVLHSDLHCEEMASSTMTSEGKPNHLLCTVVCALQKYTLSCLVKFDYCQCPCTIKSVLCTLLGHPTHTHQERGSLHQQDLVSAWSTNSYSCKSWYVKGLVLILAHESCQ